MPLTAVKRLAKPRVPARSRVVLQKALLTKRLVGYQAPSFFCVFCDRQVSGHLVGVFPTLALACPHCSSLSRQRVLAGCLDELGLTGRDVLHFAPEPCLRSRIGAANPRRHVCGDLEPDRYGHTEPVDIEAIRFEDESFDYVIASHILEHVDDAKALDELHRVLRVGGTLFLAFPLVSAWDDTYENDAVVSPEERELHFGQFDHVRFYGRDVEELMRARDFGIDKRIVQGDEAVRFGLDRGEVLYLLEKR